MAFLHCLHNYILQHVMGIWLCQEVRARYLPTYRSHRDWIGPT